MKQVSSLLFCENTQSVYSGGTQDTDSPCTNFWCLPIDWDPVKKIYIMETIEDMWM